MTKNEQQKLIDLKITDYKNNCLHMKLTDAVEYQHKKFGSSINRAKMANIRKQIKGEQMENDLMKRINNLEEEVHYLRNRVVEEQTKQENSVQQQQVLPIETLPTKKQKTTRARCHWTKTELSQLKTICFKNREESDDLVFVKQLTNTFKGRTLTAISDRIGNLISEMSKEFSNKKKLFISENSSRFHAYIVSKERLIAFLTKKNG